MKFRFWWFFCAYCWEPIDVTFKGWLRMMWFRIKGLLKGKWYKTHFAHMDCAPEKVKKDALGAS